MTDKQVMQQALAYDPETGVFTWTNKAFHKRNRGTVAGSKKRNGYVEIQVDGKMLKAHRLAWLMSVGELLDGLEIDHIDGDRSNNKLVNLRAVTKAVNQQNQRKPRSDNTSGFLGVSKNGTGWKAEIHVEGKRLRLGTFANPETAHEVYLKAKRQHHEGCTI